jgi:hypothetical protein
LKKKAIQKKLSANAMTRTEEFLASKVLSHNGKLSILKASEAPKKKLQKK